MLNIPLAPQRSRGTPRHEGDPLGGCGPPDKLSTRDHQGRLGAYRRVSPNTEPRSVLWPPKQSVRSASSLGIFDGSHRFFLPIFSRYPLGLLSTLRQLLCSLHHYHTSHLLGSYRVLPKAHVTTDNLPLLKSRQYM